VERVKGGIKLFVGRLPREVSQKQLRSCFEEFGEVVEVFVIDSQALSNVGCAFVRMASVEDAEAAIQDLHEQRILVPKHREMGPMQVAFAKGEALRLGIDEREEILPSFKEARMKVVEHNEKRDFFEKMTKQQEMQQKTMEEQMKVQRQAANAGLLKKSELVALIKDGQRLAGQEFRQRWWRFCDTGLGGGFDYDPAHHRVDSLAQFVGMMSMAYSRENWFRKRLADLPPAPVIPGMPMPPMMPFPHPGMMPPPGMGPGFGMPMPMMLPGGPPPPYLPPPPRMGLMGGPDLPPPSVPANSPRRIKIEAPDSRSSPTMVGQPKPRSRSPSPVLLPGGVQRRRIDYTDVDNLSDHDAGSEIAIEDINVDDI